jgi:hypothetical protein
MDMTLHRSLLVGILAIIAGCAAHPVQAQDIEYVAGSTTPRVQLTGEHFQITVDGTKFSAKTQAETLSRYGVLGTDLGHPVVVSDKILLLFGDTIGAYRTSDRYVISRGVNGASDSIGYISDGDFSQCRYIGNVADALTRGVREPAVTADNCPVTRFYTNPVRAADEHVFKPLVISGLAGDESQSTFRVPTAGFTYNDRMYVFFTTKQQDERPVDAFVLQSILARSDQSPAAWSDTSPATFTKLYTVSSHDAIADPANPPAVAGGTGKFIFMPTKVMDAAQLSSAGLTRLLPAELQGARDVVFVWGSSWRALRSNVYLAAFAAGDLETGTSAWFYYSGNGRWSRSEQDAAGLLATDDTSHHSVEWSEALGRFVMMRGQNGRIVAQFSAAPWGPWSDPVVVFSIADPWWNRLMHRPGVDSMVQSLEPIYARDGSRFALPDDDQGVAYNPNVLHRFTRNTDGSVTVYYTLSTWNPYQVFLMSSTFRATRR